MWLIRFTRPFSRPPSANRWTMCRTSGDRCPSRRRSVDAPCPMLVADVLAQPRTEGGRDGDRQELPRLSEQGVRALTGFHENAATTAALPTLPGERFLSRTPLLFEVIRPAPPRRTTEVEALVPLLAAPPNGFPVEEVVGTLRTVVTQDRRPRHRQRVLERKTQSAPDRPVAIADENQ